jgi:hypothetical protein
MYLSHDIMVTRDFIKNGGVKMTTKDKIKKIAEKVAGVACIILGMILGYQGVRMCTKKTYAKADIPEREYTTIE